MSDARTDSPLLAQNQWNDALIRGSFTGIEIAAHDFDGPAQRSTMMVSKATHNTDDLTYSTKVIVVDPVEAMYMTARDIVRQLSDTGSQSSIQGWPTSEFTKDFVYVILDSEDKPLLSNLSPELFQAVICLIKGAAKILWVTMPRVIRTTENPETGLITGLARTARVEDQALKFVTLEFKDGCVNVPCLIADLVRISFYGDPALRTKELEYLYKDGQLLIPRLFSNEKVGLSQSVGVEFHSEPFRRRDRPLRLCDEALGFAHGLCFCDDEYIRAALLQPSEIEIEVVVQAVVPSQVTPFQENDALSTSKAAECAGIITRVGSHLKTNFEVGDRVCAWGKMPLASYIRMSGTSVCRVPATMPFAEAAKIPIATLTTYYSLIEVANLQKGQTLLIHLTDSSVTETAIQIARDIGAEVILLIDVTIEKQRIVDKYHIPQTHILSNKSRRFQTEVQQLTAGKGADAALVSLSGSFVSSSSECIAMLGTMVALGKQGNVDLPNLLTARNIKFAAVDFDNLCQYRSEELSRMMTKVMPVIQSGEPRILSPVTLMPIADVEKALELVQGPNAPSKLMLESETRSEVKVLGRKAPVSQLRDNATYVIAGGLGGIGLRACKVLARHGARNLVILSRRVLDDESLCKIRDDFRDFDLELRVLSCDITDPSSLQKVVSNEMSGMPPVHGVVQSTMVLKVSSTAPRKWIMFLSHL